jgi:phosphoenolpyruvate carboxykinase (ATP)
VNLLVFNLSIPTSIRGIDNSILDPANGRELRTKWNIAATDLALKFINNFSIFTSNPEITSLTDQGPKLS